MLALAPSYHGNTLLALSASSREQYQTYYRNWLVQVVRAPAAPDRESEVAHGRLGVGGEGPSLREERLQALRHRLRGLNERIDLIEG